MGIPGFEQCSICLNPYPEGQLTELLDGQICPECQKRLSHWFTDLDTAEVDEILDQIKARSANAKALASFHPNRRFGNAPAVLVDDEAQTFVVVEDPENASAENPDLLTFEQVLDCSCDVEEERTEIGHKLYQYSYRFRICIDLDHDFLDTIEFYLNEQPVVLESSEKSFMGFGGFDPEGNPAYDRLQNLADQICDVLNGDEDDEDDEYDEVDEDDEDDEEYDDEDAPLVICPWCGSEVPENDDMICSNCGGSLEED